MKKIFLVFVIFFCLSSADGAELFYSNGTSVVIEKSEEFVAVKIPASKAAPDKNAVYSLNTGSDVYSFVGSTGKKGGNELPVYFLGDVPVVAERTVFWRGEKTVEEMGKKYGMKLAEIFPNYPLYAFSVEGDSVEISERIVKNGDGYAFPNFVREAPVPDSVQENNSVNYYFDGYYSNGEWDSDNGYHFEDQWHLHNTGTGKHHYSNIPPQDENNLKQNADVKFVQMLEFLKSNSDSIGIDENIKIAIMDSGVARHEDLKITEWGYDSVTNQEAIGGGTPNVHLLEGENVSNDTKSAVPHGTECAGVSAGTGNKMSGVCPWCWIYPVRYPLSNSYESSERVATSTDRYLIAYDKYVNYDISVVNCSFGPASYMGISYPSPAEIESHLHFMKNGRDGKGGVIVYSSGNDDIDSSYKRILEYNFKFERNGAEVTDRVVTVNASTAWDTKAEYSNYGTVSTVTAPSGSTRPSVRIGTTTIPDYGDYPLDAEHKNYTIDFGGTSAAAPVVSGFFGVLFSINPQLTLEEAMKILKQSSDKINPETGFWDENGFSVKYGYGRVNLEKAVRIAAGFPMCAEIKDEECGNNLDDDCNGYVDEGCAEELYTGNPCVSNDANDKCRGTGYECFTDVAVNEEYYNFDNKKWFFKSMKNGYCFSKSTYDATCPDGTRVFDFNGDGSAKSDFGSDGKYFCALECNSSNPCLREGYYCSDEVFGVCLPLCPDYATCAEGYFCNENGHCVTECGNGIINREDCDGYDNCVVTDGANEECDDGEDNGRKCPYGETSCTICKKNCKIGAGHTSYCGNGIIDPHYGEACDDRNNEDGDYCSSDCKTVTGYCGDGTTQSNEQCDNASDNGRTDCVYGETSCTVCTTKCKTAAGTTSFCGDGNTDSSNNEQCDNASDNGRTNCTYGETSCTVCTTECKTADGLTSFCGDGVKDETNGEICDDGDNNGEYAHCNNTCSGLAAHCGDGIVDSDNGEFCDRGFGNGETNCLYGETSCTVCTTECKTAAGLTSFCGDGTRDSSNNEQCDNASDNGRTACAYGETSCTVCTAECKTADGTTSYCGDGTTDSSNNEQCDNASDNGRTNCAYGETSCTVCTAECKTAAGTTSYCGDGTTDSSNNEQCDNASDNGRTACAYGETSCTVCTNECKTAAGLTSFCGDGTTDSANGEVCDDGNNKDGDYCSADCKTVTGRCGDSTVQNNETCDDGNTANGDYCSSDCQTITGSCGDGSTQNNEQCDNASDNGKTNCAYGETSCTVCTAECKTAAGITSFCGDGIKDSSNNEQCDNASDNGRTNCAYGETSCTVCTAECKTAAGSTSFCGDETTDSSNNEQCDNASDNGRTNCAYGETSCIVCTAECKTAAGLTYFCGDGTTDSANGEVCDDGAENGSSGHCNTECSGRNEIPDEDIPDEDNTDEDMADDDELSDDDEIADGDETSDIDEEISDSEPSDNEETNDSNEAADADNENQDNEESPDSSETTDDNEKQDESGVSADEDTVGTDDNSVEPASDNDAPAESGKKKNGGCSLIVL